MMRTPEEVLEVCRDAWREAAMRNRPQVHLSLDGHSIPVRRFTGACAASLVTIGCLGSLNLISRDEYMRLRFRCPHHPGAHYLPHFNDRHGWDWLTLATKLGVEPYGVA